MNFSQSVSTCLSKFATFSGRASRSEYWWFYLAVTLFSYLLQIVFGIQALNEPTLAGFSMLVPYCFNLVLSIPVFAAGSRRLHDIGKSGWWQLLAFTIIGLIPLIIWFAREGSKEPNIYGPPVEL